MTEMRLPRGENAARLRARMLMSLSPHQATTSRLAPTFLATAPTSTPPSGLPAQSNHMLSIFKEGHACTYPISLHCLDYKKMAARRWLAKSFATTSEAL